MTSGTLDFYSTAAQLTPLIVVTYLVESRLRVGGIRPPSMEDAKWKERQRRIRQLRNRYDMIVIFGGIGSTAASLLTLYSGKPTGQSVFWTVAPLCLITMVMIGSFLASKDLEEK